MAKVVLVMDDPMNCEHCPLFHRVPGDTYCAKGTMPVPMFGKPYWCPLIPEPERSPVVLDDEYAEGWNACLDALEGQND